MFSQNDITGSHRKKSLENLKKSKLSDLWGDKNLEEWLNEPSNLAALVGVKNCRGVLSKCVPQPFTNQLNATNLTLYSGPLNSVSKNIDSTCQPAEQFLCQVLGETCLSETRVSWLGTGDGKFNNQARTNRIVNHLGEERFKKIITYTVPHHGSKHDFCAEFATRCDSANAVLTYGVENGHGHPAANTLGDLARSNAKMVFVTNLPATRFSEWFDFFQT